MRGAPGLSGRPWAVADHDPGEAGRLAADLGLHPVVARVLAARGHGDPAAARAWLDPGPESLHDPFEMADMPVAVQRLEAAIRDDEPVRIVTDYDVDGVTSSLVLQAVLRLRGHRRLSWHIPHRMEEGYGLSRSAVETAARDGVRLLVTADIGIREHETIARAAALGIDTIVCDHHLPEGADIPDRATAVLCPPRPDCPYPNPALAACGVSFKLAQALLARNTHAERLLRSLAKLVAVGTVADVVDLSTPENRALVRWGLEALNADRHAPGLQALLDRSRVPAGRIRAADIAYRIAPRLNAAGRMGSARRVVELLACRDPSRAAALADELEAANTARREAQAEMVERALAALPEPPPPFALVWGDEGDGWHRGLTGIVAARLRERLARPAGVAAVAGATAVGSVRCPPAHHAVEILASAEDLLDRFGGHAAAAGFALPADRLPALAERLAGAMEAAPASRRPRVADADLGAEELDADLLRGLAALEPCGKGNPAPLLLVRGAGPLAWRPLRGGHLKARLPGADVLWWGGEAHLDALRARSAWDLLGRLEPNHWRGRTTPQLVVEDARPAVGGR